MNHLGWKLTTAASLSVAALFAFRGPGTAEAPKPRPQLSTPAAGAPRPSFFGGFFAPPPVNRVPALAEALRMAATPAQACQALEALGEAGGDEAVGAIGAAVTSRKNAESRVCAAEALRRAGGAAARTWIIDLVDDRDAAVREAALGALAKSDDEQARAAALEAAHHPDAKRRSEALVALAKNKVREAAPLLLAEIERATPATLLVLVEAMGDSGDPAMAPVLERMMRHPSSGVRASAMTALAHLGGDVAARALVSALERAPSSDVSLVTSALAEMRDAAGRSALFVALRSERHAVAMAALQALSTLEGDDVRELMAKELAGQDPDRIACACNYVGATHDETAVPRLVEMARHGGPRVIGQALSALAAIGNDEARAAVTAIAGEPGPWQSSALAQLADMPGGDEVARTMWLKAAREDGALASQAMSILSEDGGADARDALLDALRSDGPRAADAARALARRAEPETVRALMDAATRADRPDVRAGALAALGESADPDAVRVLAGAVGDADPQVRAAALGGLGAVGGESAERALLDATRSEDSTTRAAAVSSLRELGTSSVTPALEKLARDPEPSVAQSAIEGLAALAPDRAVTILAGNLRGSDPEARLAALQMASTLRPDDARSLYLTGLSDSDPSLVALSLAGLGQTGGVEAERALADVLTRSSSSVETRRSAALALEEIGGEPARRYRDLIARAEAEPATE